MRINAAPSRENPHSYLISSDHHRPVAVAIGPNSRLFGSGRRTSGLSVALYWHMKFRTVVLVLASVLFACTPSNATPTTTLPVTPPSSTSSMASAVEVTPTIPFSAANPSQSPEDAARDGVAPLVAAAPLELRINRHLTAGDSGWSWVVSRLTEDFVTLANNAGLREYGELLLMRGIGSFARSPRQGRR